MTRVLVSAMALLLLALSVACSDDGDDPQSTAAQSTAAQNTAAESTEPTAGVPDSGESSDDGESTGAAPSGTAGTLALGDELLTVDHALCYMEEQDAAAGGGKILFVVQGFGSFADGTEFLIDVSRYDEDSMFTGDSITVDVGDPFSDDAYSWAVWDNEIGTVELDGSAVRASDLTFYHSDDMTETTGAFEIDCG